jgi:hypothetical protein
MQQQHELGLVITRLARVCEGSASTWALKSTQDLLLCALPESLTSQLLSAAYDVGLELLVGWERRHLKTVPRPGLCLMSMLRLHRARRSFQKLLPSHMQARLYYTVNVN